MSAITSPSSVELRRVCAFLALVACALAAGCSTSLNRAPVEDRTAPAAGAASVAAEIPPKAPPGFENLGKPGYYAVKPGDTMLRVALENGQNWRDIARWNNIDNPNVLEVGQVLRVVPPGADATAAATKGVNAAKVETRPLDAKPIGATPIASAPTTAAAAPPPSRTAMPATPPPATPPAADDDVAWAWPTTAVVVAPFDDVRNKGLMFTGKAGDPVLAAADGRVVYAGSGLRGYGNLVIVRHNNSFLTAYAHNQTLLVKEDQAVRRGQKIAEMGSSDAERVQLHFEIRRLGKPIDPARLLPPR